MLAITHADYLIRRALAHEENAIRTLVRSERLKIRTTSISKTSPWR